MTVVDVNCVIFPAILQGFALTRMSFSSYREEVERNTTIATSIARRVAPGLVTLLLNK
jgi:hypothetical protein